MHQDFVIKEDPRGNTLGRGTQIILHIKEDAIEYLDVYRIKQLVETHSQFIQFPIYVWETKTTTEQVPIEEKEEIDPVQDVTDDDSSKKPKTKTVEKKTSEWELVNKQKPLWTRRPADLKAEEYEAFYKAFAKEYSGPLAYSHFRAEGDVEFHSMLFIPERSNTELFSRKEVIKNIKLFVRRVFITDDLTDLLPSYLSFIKVCVLY